MTREELDDTTACSRKTRAQTELPALGIALVLLTTVLVLGLASASTALSAAERPAVERQAAVGLSEQLVADSAPLTTRANTVDPDAVAGMTRDELESVYGLAPEHDVRIELDGETIVESGTPAEGTTVNRLVVTEHREERTLEPAFETGRAVTLPRRTSHATLTIDPPPETVVRTVRADDRVVLHSDEGLRGTFDVALSRFETKRLSFEAAGVLSEGDVDIEYYPAQTRKATLSVTIDA